jgi:undecaprenyl-diphosphatase
MRKKRSAHSRLILLALCIALLILTFAVIKVHAAAAVDLAIVKTVFGMRSAWGVAVFAAFTSLGDTLSVGLVLCAACLILALKKRDRAYIIGLAVAVGGAKLTEIVMKIAIERARPDGFALFHLDTYSFPSGHATGAMALYGFVAYILCALYPRKRVLWIAPASFIIFMIGASRVYLGVHFPSDVLGGFLVGSIWILIGISAVKYWRS